MCRILSRKKACSDIKNIFCATLQPITTLMEALLVFLLFCLEKKLYTATFLDVKQKESIAKKTKES